MGATPPRSLRLNAAIVLLAMAAFAALCLYHYQLPGLYYDEAFDAVPAMQLLFGQPVELSRGVALPLLGRQLPVMIGDYWGAVSTYAVLPLLALLGPGPLAVRLWPIGAGVAAVLLTYVVGRRLFTPGTGALAAALLAVFPSFVFWSRIGIYVISHVVAITLGIAWCWLRWRRSGRTRWLLLAGLVAGVGLWTKLLFIWFFIAVPAAYAALLADDALADAGRWRSLGPWTWLRQRARADLPFRAASLILAGAGLIAGAFPLLYYNAVSRGSLLLLRANLFQTSRGVSNFALLENLRVEADALKVLLEGSYFWFYGGIFTNPLYPPLTAAAAVVLLVLTHRLPAYASYRRPVTFMLAFSAVIFLLSCFTISILGATHLLILLPVPQLCLAAAAMLGGRALGRRAWLPAGVAVLALGPLAARDLWVDAQYHHALATSGGHSTFSSAIYDLSAALDTQAGSQPYALDWGFRYPVMLLTHGRVAPREIFGQSYEPGAEFEAALRQAVGEPGARFVSHTEEASTVPRLDAFRRIATAAGRPPVLERTFHQRDGKPVYYVFRVG